MEKKKITHLYHNNLVFKTTKPKGPKKAKITSDRYSTLRKKPSKVPGQSNHLKKNT